MSVPKFEGPHLVPLLDGTLVFDDSPEWGHLNEALRIAAMERDEVIRLLSAIEQTRGPEAAARLQRTIEDIRVMETSHIGEWP